MRAPAIGLLVSAALGACNGHQDAQAPPPAPAAPALQPEMLIHWDGDGQVACLTPDLMIEFIDHAKAHETTKGLAMLKPGAPCSFIPHGGTAKIVSIGRGDRYPLIEVVAAGSGASDGMWTPSQGAIIGIAPTP